MLGVPEMEGSMRDLDQLRERDSDERGRRLGTFVMFAVVTIVLVSAVAVVIGQTLRPRNAEPDQLDQLDRVAGALAKPRDPKLDPAPPAPVPIEPVDPRQLTFEPDLTETEERPEVLAALEAAAREAEELAESEAKARRANAPGTSGDESDEDDEAALAPKGLTVLPDEAYEPLPDKRWKGALPAGMTATDATQKLAKAAQHDKLVAAALPGRERLPLAPAGSEGEFTLQVISFDSGSQAQAFATSLRAKGHEAFVVSGEVPGRSRSYRVRIGPFKTKQQADTYRKSFEEQEHMNTIVLKR